MTAQEAKIISQREVHYRVIEIIEQAAKEGKTEVNLNDIPLDEGYYFITDIDRKWLINNGYKIIFKKEFIFDGYDDMEYVTWD